MTGQTPTHQAWPQPAGLTGPAPTRHPNEVLADALRSASRVPNYHDQVLAVAEAALAGGGAVPLRFPVGQPAVLSPSDASALVDFARSVVDGVLALPAPGERQPESVAPVPLLRACSLLMVALKAASRDGTPAHLADDVQRAALDLWSAWSAAGGAEADVAAGGAP